MMRTWIVLMGAATAAWMTMAAGCGSTVGGGSDTDCPPGAEGGDCAVVGQSCGEMGECGGYETVCGADHTWSTTWYDEQCCGPAPTCPATPPKNGDPCDICTDATDCAFTTSCGAVTASCTDFTWVVTPGDCPLDACATQSEASCQLDPNCRWLVPGCGTPALPAPGCFPIADCTPGSCAAPATTCQTVIQDPCYGKGCNACSAEVSVCLP